MVDDLFLEIQGALAEVSNSQDDILWYIYRKEKEMSDEMYTGLKPDTVYFLDGIDSEPVELKGLKSLSENMVNLSASIEESTKVFQELGKTWSSLTYNFESERDASRLLWAIFGITKKQLKEEALAEHYRKKALRDATRENPERSKMHAAYRRRQKSRGKRNKH